MKRLIKSAHEKLYIQLILVMRRTEWTIQGNVHTTQIEDKKKYMQKNKKMAKTVVHPNLCECFSVPF